MSDRIDRLTAPLPQGAVPAAGRESFAAGPVHVILNPTAAGGRAKRLESRILAGLTDRFGPDYTLCVTERAGHASASASAAVAAGTALVVAVGGDGTVHEILNGLLRTRPTVGARCELGIVNCGTGSGLADSLGLPDALDGQLDLLTLPYSVAIDVGHVAYRDASGRAAQRWFASECQVGIGSVVTACVHPTSKRFGGRLAFGAATLRSVFRHRASALSVSYNGTGATTLPLLGLAIGNGHICAGGMRLTPGARLDDGVFDVLTIHDMGIPTRLVNFPRIYAGSHVQSPRFAVHRTGQLTIAAEPPVSVSADGECLGFTPCRISLLPAALRIRSGRPHGS